MPRVLTQTDVADFRERLCEAATRLFDARGREGFTMRELASELGVWRIRVNLVLPGVIETAMTRSLIDDPAIHADAISNTPVGRLGKPEDIARLAVFLCGDDAGYVTGAEVLADGGQALHGYPRWFSADYGKVGAEFTPHTQR